MGGKEFGSQPFDEANNEGGNTAREKESHLPGNPLFGESARAIDLIGQRLIKRIDGMNYKELSDDETALARYYRYSTAVSLRGMNRKEFLPTDPSQREIEMLHMELGARLAASDYLQEFPNSLSAAVIALKGMEAPDEIHQLLNLQGMGRRIVQFVKKHNP